MRIAMWSGPRNLSTACMYAFGARDDFAVVDEPFYAAYLAKSAIEHPMRAEILAAQSSDPSQVISELTGSIPDGKPHYYQKHMTQHMVFDGTDDWMKDFSHIFLIRHPARVIASYGAKRENPTLDDIGFHQQARLFDEITAAGGNPVVIDSHDIRDDPEKMLRRLCDAIGLSWDAAMLNWPAGGHKDDGVWASHWYGAAHRSTGFAGSEGPLPDVPASMKSVLDAALISYERLFTHKL